MGHTAKPQRSPLTSAVPFGHNDSCEAGLNDNLVSFLMRTAFWLLASTRSV
jgi:hypothetical protein